MLVKFNQWSGVCQGIWEFQAQPELKEQQSVRISVFKWLASPG